MALLRKVKQERDRRLGLNDKLRTVCDSRRVLRRNVQALLRGTFVAGMGLWTDGNTTYRMSMGCGWERNESGDTIRSRKQPDLAAT